MQSQELMEYILGTIKSIVRSGDVRGAVYSGTLIFSHDDTAFYEVPLKNIDPIISFGFYTSGSEFVYDNSYVSITYRKWIEIKNTLNNSIRVYENDNMREDEIFEAGITSKTSDGAVMYFIKTSSGKSISIPLFNGLPLVSKGDTISFELYDLMQHDHYIVHLMVNKKKISTMYNMWFKIINVNRNLKEW